ncbi:DUF4429 domain-containing protein [Streptomyces aidingensis]|uniref:Short C-terminal domain-containing protein n=1 Tax=Streptomyces aidingensis TaxID=910347 RepID=A0A1I1EZQ8_9ACTN|nr:DUF4429 domain-containing protein [Streptomyces aidingensis]SFB92635.1 Short C-terminal domain-containing protein [Streptomyces aidingensis]
MAEITQQSGTWSFDGEAIRIVPGSGRGRHALRSALGELTVPLSAVAGVSFEPGRKGGGRLRLRMRPGADPLSQATAGRLPEAAEPYVLEVDPGGEILAEYLVDEVREARLLEQVPDTPADRYLLPGPGVPLLLKASDGTLAFDGETLRLEWLWTAEESKKSVGPRVIPFAEVSGLEWSLPQGLENGYVRVVTRGPQTRAAPDHDPCSVVLWGVRKTREVTQVALLAAAVAARLPHPCGQRDDPAPLPVAGAPSPVKAGPPGTAPAEAPGGDGHDALLRRLRELGELHAAGVLTEEEFRTAKKAVLDRF